MEVRDPIAEAVASFSSIGSYSVTLRSSTPGRPATKTENEIIRYFYLRPGFIRMEFVKPHQGSILVYDPETGKARLRPFGFIRPLVLTLSPSNSLITSSRGHRVDESDIGALLGAASELARGGEVRVEGVERLEVINPGLDGPISGPGSVDEEPVQREVLVVEVTGLAGHTVRGGIARYRLWLDRVLLLPLKAEAFDAEGELLESVLMDDLRVNIGLDPTLFDLLD